MRLAARNTIVAGALAAAAIAAPAASARFNLEPGSTGPTQTTATAAAVLPNPDQQAGQVTRVGPPALHAVPGSQIGALHRAETASAHRFAYQPSPSARYSSAGLNGHVSSPTGGIPAVVHVTTHSNPFDWGDAAIGAAGGLVISLLIVGGAVLASQRRAPQERRAKLVA
ncbi:MAG: hypothetical protein ACXVFQ_22610 [Solirubrobacteraceae bacterium]